MAARPAAPIVKLMRIRFSGAFGRAIITATVAATSESRMKKCEIRKPSSTGFVAGRALVEVAELIVQTLAQGGVLRRGGVGGRHGRHLCGPPRPLPRDEPDRARAGAAHHVGQQPGEAVEAP